MKQIYNYDNNSILFIRKSGHTFDLKLCKGITIIDGASATGKTLLFNDIKALKDLNPQTTGYDVSNIELITRNSDIIDDNIIYSKYFEFFLIVILLKFMFFFISDLKISNIEIAIPNFIML